MRILGIDPGTGITGWGIVDKDYNRLTVVDYGCIRTPANSLNQKRLCDIYDGLLLLLQEYQQNPEATTKQRSLSLQLLAACLNMMHRSEVNTNLLERLQHQPPNLSLREPGRKYPLGNGGISNEDIALEIVNAHQEDFEAPEQLQRLLIELKKYENFGRLV